MPFFALNMMTIIENKKSRAVCSSTARVMQNAYNSSGGVTIRGVLVKLRILSIAILRLTKAMIPASTSLASHPAGTSLTTMLYFSMRQ